MSESPEDISTILGISAYFHDSAACLIRDGVIIAAAQEERFTRKKNDAAFPTSAVAWCLSQANLSIHEIDQVAYYEQPRLKFERIRETWLAVAPRGFAPFRQALPIWLSQRLRIETTLTAELGGRPRQGFVFPEHHQSHGAAAFYPSPFEDACVLSMDGVGEWATTSIGIGEGHELKLIEEIRFPHSLGLLYAAFTSYIGFQVNSGEFEVMGLAAYGEPIYRDWILEKVIDLKDDGSFHLNIDYFDFCHRFAMTSNKMQADLGWPQRSEGDPIEQREKDLAASIQSVTETIIIRMALHASKVTNKKNLVLAGGVALNCVANGRILREGPFENIWIQPAANDAGGALGAALFAWHQVAQKKRILGESDSQQGSRLGSSFTQAQAQAALQEYGVVYRNIDNNGELTHEIASLLDEGKIVGHFEGKMEFGPRALGGRSILADPRPIGMKDRINKAVKFRATFRPFAPCVLREHVAEYFATPPNFSSPYMAIVAPVAKEKEHLIPAVTHVGSTARVQTVEEGGSNRLFDILTAFQELTGVPILLNTSFNVRGEPIVCTPLDALRCFMKSGLDVLVIENCIVLKSEQDRVSLRSRLDLEEEKSPDRDNGPKKPKVPIPRHSENQFTLIWDKTLTLLLGVLYFALLSPIAVLLRLSGRDKLALRPNRRDDSFWIKRDG